MTYIQWKDTYNIGIEEVDQQHKKLVEILNELYEAHQHVHARFIIDDILIRLADYTVYHFESEEKWFDKINYSGAEIHKLEHREFVKTIDQFKLHAEGGNLLLTLKTLDYLKDWTITHILGTDKEFGEVFKSLQKN